MYLGWVVKKEVFVVFGDNPFLPALKEVLVKAETFHPLKEKTLTNPIAN